MGLFKQKKLKELLQKQEKKYTILLVDDEEANLRATSRLLENDYNVILAKDGQEGLRIVKEQKDSIHLIISDQRMPYLTGVVFLKQTVGINPKIIRIILTGYTDIQSIIASINEAHIYQFVVKPIETEDFLLTVKRALEFYELESKNTNLIQELKELNLGLEQKVKDRTKELQTTLRDIQKDLKVAKKIQQSILPDKIKHYKNVKFITHYLPMQEVGGDFYDIESLSENYVRIFIADATGHGVQAALFTMAIKVEYDALKRLFLTPNKILSQLNNQFMKKFVSAHAIFSCAILDLDFQNQKLLYSAAGHPEQFVIQNTGLIKLTKTGKIIGISSDVEYGKIELPLPKGRVFLLTDGAFEQFDTRGEEYGAERVSKYLVDNQNAKLENCIEGLVQNIKQFLIETELQDDITIIGIELN